MPEKISYMRKRGLLRRFLFFINSLFALGLLLAYLLPYISPEQFPYLAVLSLGMPVLILANVLFLIFWVIRLKRELLLSLIVLGVGFNHVVSLYKFKSINHPETEEELKLMSYNVRHFNRRHWIEDKDVPKEMEDFIAEEDPDIISFQEYVAGEVDLSQYPYKYRKLIEIEGDLGQAIYSKHPLINGGSFDFPGTINNVIYADALVHEDTLRIYNIHLQSLQIDSDLSSLDKAKGKLMTQRIGSTFRDQQKQVEQLLDSVEQTPHPTIINGDMNNTPFSYAYRKMSDGFQDAFKEAGKGSGRTFVMDFIPLRIDVLLIDPEYRINGFKTYDVKLSDHYPISTRIEKIK